MAAEIRVKAECFKNRKLDVLKLITQNCRPVCAWAKNTIDNKNVDQGSMSVLKYILKRQQCTG